MFFVSDRKIAKRSLQKKIAKKIAKRSHKDRKKIAKPDSKKKIAKRSQKDRKKDRLLKKLWVTEMTPQQDIFHDYAVVVNSIT